MVNKKVGDRMMGGRIIAINGPIDDTGHIINVEDVLVKQDNGQTRWWSL